MSDETDRTTDVEQAPGDDRHDRAVALIAETQALFTAATFPARGSDPQDDQDLAAADDDEDTNDDSDDDSDSDSDSDDTDEDGSADGTAGQSVPSFGVLFQAPDLSDVPRRRSRRATSAVTAPVERQDEDEDDQTHDEGSDDSGEDDGPGSRAGRRRRRGGKGRRGRTSSDQGEDDDDGSQSAGSADAGGKEQTESTDQGETEQEGSGTARRRSRRGRGTGTGQHDDGRSADAKDEASAEDAGTSEDDDSSSTRRRRRRRRSGESGSGERSARDEVTSLKGSTRLEAKRQRRREGREAGRRRTIITEAEFLARRESVERVMVVRGLEDRTQIAVLEDGVPVEHYVSRSAQTTMAGNVYLGRVQNVLPSMEAAFVDIGKGRNAVLYAGEVNWDAAGMSSGQPKRIENALKSGQTVLVQVTKDPIGHKGARLTSQVSLPGRYLVYVPGSSMTGISRKLPDTERARLKKILKEVVPDDVGVIVRTAAEGASEAELRADVERLSSTWERIQKKSGSANAPALLHGEPDMTVRVIRDVFTEDFAKLVVAGDEAWTEVKRYIDDVAPDLADRVEKHTGTQDAFTAYRVHEAIAKAMDRKVWLPSGGSLVIDRTEAMTVVDVNTGKFTGSGGNLEETVTKNNIEAAEEIVRQLRLRDIGGIIVIDFIDMVLESNRDLVVRRLLECLGRDRTKHQVAEVTSLGLVQMTRKRVGSGLIEVFSETCAHCAGRGIIVQTEPAHRHGNGNGGSEDSGGRRGRSKGRSGSSSGGGEGRTAQQPSKPTGPTPAQIAAAAHAAAVQAGEKPVAAETAADPVAGGQAMSTPGTAVEQAVSEQAVSEQAATEQPATKRRAAKRSPARPAAEQPAAEQPAAEQPADERSADQEPAADEPAREPAPVVEAALAPAPKRRRRGRVVAPAGPPTGAPEGGPATGPATDPA
ncbi:Rne/Rng family ribonuclease [Ornithinimicrobium avium]|uniref:Rne/Rng family ribonuclease n=1 Tax=Ornithinimicrobium avium TaxID=2283195 RepID=UPI001D17E85F|nr:Rne/Rng family ribonuclease [Ornithinimicrobium avium]